MQKFTNECNIRWLDTHVENLCFTYPTEKSTQQLMNLPFFTPIGLHSYPQSWSYRADCHPLQLHAQNHCCQSWIYFQMTHHLSVNTFGKDVSLNSHNLHLHFLCSSHVPRIYSCRILFSLTFFLCSFCISDLLLIVDYFSKTQWLRWSNWTFLCFLSSCFLFLRCFYSFQSLQ